MSEYEALDLYGELYRNAQGQEVWRIRNKNGTIHEDNIASDHDAAWLAKIVANA